MAAGAASTGSAWTLTWATAREKSSVLRSRVRYANTSSPRRRRLRMDPLTFGTWMIAAIAFLTGFLVCMLVVTLRRPRP